MRGNEGVIGGCCGRHGALSLSLSRAVEPDAGFPGSLKFAAERAELISNPLMTAVASLNLSLNGPLAHTARITGRVDVVSDKGRLKFFSVRSTARISAILNSRTPL